MHFSGQKAHFRQKLTLLGISKRNSSSPRLVRFCGDPISPSASRFMATTAWKEEEKNMKGESKEAPAILWTFWSYDVGSLWQQVVRETNRYTTGEQIYACATYDPTRLRGWFSPPSSRPVKISLLASLMGLKTESSDIFPHLFWVYVFFPIHCISSLFPSFIPSLSFFDSPFISSLFIFLVFVYFSSLHISSPCICQAPWGGIY